MLKDGIKIFLVMTKLRTTTKCIITEHQQPLVYPHLHPHLVRSS